MNSFKGSLSHHRALPSDHTAPPTLGPTAGGEDFADMKAVDHLSGV